MTLTDTQAQQIAEAIDKQFPDHWLNADAVKQLPDSEMVDLELPLWFVRKFKNDLAAARARAATDAFNQYVWAL